MKTKEEVLQSCRAKNTYNNLRRMGIPAQVCRGTTGDDYVLFFTTSDPFWSDGCFGWVRTDNINKLPICLSCATAVPPTRKLRKPREDNDEELGDEYNVFGQFTEPSTAEPRKLSKLPKGGKHSRKSTKSDAASKKSKSSKQKI